MTIKRSKKRKPTQKHQYRRIRLKIKRSKPTPLDNFVKNLGIK